MRILFTGASSFSGLWFVRTLAQAGHEIVCPLREAPDRYTGVRAERVNELRTVSRLESGLVFGDEKFLTLLQSQSWDILCHHAADAANYKSTDFDALAAARNNSLNLRKVLEAFRSTGGKAVVLTGTVFEAEEGQGEPPLRAFSPYGLSKTLTWQIFRYYCDRAGVPLGKFVIPNPFGPFEEPRFTAYLMNMWKQGQVAKVMTPDYRRDNIHIDLLAAVYAQFVGNVALMTGPQCVRFNPSGYPGTQGDFAQRVAAEVRSRTRWVCQLELMKQADFAEPMERVNTEPAAPLVPGWNETAAWDQFVRFYTGS